MATFNLTITYPDGQGTRIMNALKAEYGVTTNAAAIDKLREEVTGKIKNIVLHVEEFEAKKTLPAPPDVS